MIDHVACGDDSDRQTLVKVLPQGFYVPSNRKHREGLKDTLAGYLVMDKWE